MAQHFVRTNNLAARQRIINALESRSFTAENGDKQQILESQLPLKIDMEDKTYGTMGNVTCAAAVASSGRLMAAEAFYAQYIHSGLY